MEELDQTRIAREEQRDADRQLRDRKHSWQLGLFAVGRVFLGAVFVGSAVGMLADYPGTIASVQDTLFDIHRLIPLAIAFQLLAGAAIVLGWHARLFAALTAVYLVGELLIVPPDLTLDLGRAVGFAHLGLLAALAMLVAHGAGRLSLDHAREHRFRVRAAKAAAHVSAAR